MTLHITSIRRAEPDQSGGEAESAALAIYGILMERPPQERADKARVIVRYARTVCVDDYPDAAFSWNWHHGEASGAAP